MADWTKPVLTDTYVSFEDLLKARDIDSITLCKDAPTNTPVGSIRYERTLNCFQEWNGTSWINKVISLVGGGTGSGSSTPLGTMASQDANNVAITGGSASGLNSLQVTGPATIGGLVTLGSGPVQLTDATGKIRAINATYFANLDLVGDNIVTGLVNPLRLGTGTPDATKFLRGDGTWQVVSGGGTIGEWIHVPYNPANFFTKNSSGWTVEAGDIVTFAYSIVSKQMIMAVYLSNTAFNGLPPDNELRIRIPDSRTAAFLVSDNCRMSPASGTNEIGIVSTNTDHPTFVRIFRQNPSDNYIVTGTLSFNFTFIFPID